MCDLWESTLLQDEWKFASMESGGLCVMMIGTLMMPELSADNLACHCWVGKIIVDIIIIYVEANLTLKSCAVPYCSYNLGHWTCFLFNFFIPFYSSKCIWRC